MASNMAMFSVIPMAQRLERSLSPGNTVRVPPIVINVSPLSMVWFAL